MNRAEIATRIIKTLLSIAFFCGLVWVLFGENSYIRNALLERLHVDIWPSVLALVAFASVNIILSALTSLFPENFKVNLVGSSLRYLSAILLLFYFPYESLKIHTIRQYVPTLVALIIGIYAARLGGLLKGFVGFAVSGVGLVISLLSLSFLIASVLPIFSTTMLSVTAGVLLAYTLSALKFAGNESIKELGEYFSQKLPLFGFIGFIIGLYTIIRGFLLSFILQPLILSLTELVFLSVATALIIGGLFSHFNKKQLEAFIREEWKKHELKETIVLSGDASFLAEAVEDFVTRKEKSKFITHVVSVLVQLGVPLRNVAEVVHEIEAYDDEPLPMFAFGWYKKIIEKRNINRRIEFIKNISEKLKQNIEGGVSSALKYADIQQEMQ